MVAGMMTQDAESIPDEARAVLKDSVHPLETALAYFEEDILRTKERTVWTHLVRGRFMLAPAALSILTGTGYFEMRRRHTPPPAGESKGEETGSSPLAGGNKGRHFQIDIEANYRLGDRAFVLNAFEEAVRRAGKEKEFSASYKFEILKGWEEAFADGKMTKEEVEKYLDLFVRASKTPSDLSERLSRGLESVISGDLKLLLSQEGISSPAGVRRQVSSQNNLSFGNNIIGRSVSEKYPVVYYYDFRLSQKKFGEFTREEFLRLRKMGVSILWTVAVFEGSPYSRMHNEYWARQKNVRLVESAYSIRKYAPRRSMGGKQEFIKFVKRANDAGVRIMVDIVLNHLAIDTPIIRFPDFFLQPPPYQIEREKPWLELNPAHSLTPIFRHPQTGRIFYFGGRKNPSDGSHYSWSDTIQLNYINSHMRKWMLQTILDVADLVNGGGIRFDAVYHILRWNYKEQWFSHLSREEFNQLYPEEEEFLRKMIYHLKQKYPNITLLAEYWGQEGDALLDLGFDFYYEGYIRDLLIRRDITALKNFLGVIALGQKFRFMKYLETHDMIRRIVEVLGKEAALAATVLLYTLPGGTFIMHNQERGHSRWMPTANFIHGPEENDDYQFIELYEELAGITSHDAFRKGSFDLLLFKENSTTDKLIVFERKYGEEQFIVAVNYGDWPAGSNVTISGRVVEFTLPSRGFEIFEVQGNGRHTILNKLPFKISNRRNTPILDRHKADSNFASSPVGIGVIGLVGVGRQGQRILKTLLELNVKVWAVDRMIDEALSEKFRHNGSLRLEQKEAVELFSDPQIPAVIIATPGNTHYELVKQALAAGKHVLVEKPFTKNADEARELVAMAAQRNRLLMVGHNRFYLPHFQRLKALVNSGRLGKIFTIEANYLNPPQKNDRSHTALEGLGYHKFYMIHGLLGRDYPTKLLSAVRSEDWETVGLKLCYDNVPVTIRLSRDYDGPKTRTLIIRGEDFTATFDYSQEPASTQLHIQPTRQVLFDDPEFFDPLVLEELQEQTLLTDEEAEPSLYHELKAFLETLRTEVDPPSNGAAAVSVVETLEQIRYKLMGSNFYHSDPKVSVLVVSQLAKLIYERIGKQGGIVTIDGPSAVGKSTLAQPLADFYELMNPSRRALVDSLDEMRFSWQECSALKKYILGKQLTEEDKRILQENGWNEIDPGQPFDGEESIWHNALIELELQEMRKLFDRTDNPGQIIVTRYKAFIKDGSKRSTGSTRRTFRHGDLILEEGKYANRESFTKFVDVHVRLRAPLTQIRRHFQQDRGTLLNPEQLAEHMRYYDLVILPSWEAYEPRTRSRIDIVVDLERGTVNIPKKEDIFLPGS